MFAGESSLQSANTWVHSVERPKIASLRRLEQVGARQSMAACDYGLDAPLGPLDYPIPASNANPQEVQYRVPLLFRYCVLCGQHRA